ncbi:MAG TPA: hypothetical protein VMU97_02780 [Candidatus Dormibacteraeota bacterium]|nr:hypothetical protein [Candidatus Dormibacteraeota bacterium]
MSKNKNSQTTADKITEAARQSGFLLMAAAATLGMLELPEHPNSKIVLTSQPVFAFASHNVEDQGQANQMRRERDETVPHYMSYSVAQRTPSRSGKT